MKFKYGLLRIFTAAAATGFVAPTAIVRADAIWVGETAKNPIKADGVKIVRIEGGQITYATAGGAQIIKPLAQVQQLSADDEPAFNKAEESYRDGKWADAVDGYQKAVQTTARDWVKDRAAVRLVDVAGKANRFDAAVTAFVALAQKDPATATKSRPLVTDAAARYFDPAITEVNKALDSTKLSDPQRGVLLSFLLEIYRAKKDTNGVNQTLQQLVKINAATPADMAVLKLASAQAALDANDYAKATSEIQQNRALFTEPAAQVDALYTLARAKDGIDGDKDDPNALKDIAIAYVRMVTFARELPGQPHVAQALLRVAQIEEKLKEPQVALQLYQQITKDYADQPVAGDARAGIERLGKGT